MIALTIISILIVMFFIQAFFMSGPAKHEPAPPLAPYTELTDEQRFALMAKYQAIIDSKSA